MHVTHGTNVGLVRGNNEDSYVCAEPHIFAVADGMGGHAAGEVASKLLIGEIRKNLETLSSVTCDEKMLQQCITTANSIILSKSAENRTLAGMGTTASIICLQTDKVIWAHIGDSRIYCCHAGQLRQITTDHSLVDAWVKNGTITAEEALHHPQKNILTRAVGVETDIKVDTGTFPVETGDKLLLATDGLTNMVENAEIKQIMFDESIHDKAEFLIQEALQHGGIDNITAIVVEL